MSAARDFRSGSFASFCWCPRHVRLSSGTYREGEPAIGALAQHRHARAHAISDPGTAFIGSNLPRDRAASCAVGFHQLPDRGLAALAQQQVDAFQHQGMQLGVFGMGEVA